MFIGCFNLDFSANPANSPAANQVQIEIFENICKTFGQSDVIASVNKPQRTWPYSQFIQRSQVVGKYKFQGFCNILFLKDIVIYFRHLLLAISFEPVVVFKYNITLFESIFLFFLKKILRLKVVVFIQDVSYQNRKSSFINRHLETLAIKISSSFDVLVPITKDFLNDFTLNEDKCLVFQGGLTSQSKILMSSKIDFDVVSNSKHIVFAGALEEYNGIKDIVDYWFNNNVDFSLHIYGKGTFENYVKARAKKIEGIKYFGFASESVIISDQLSAYGNFCFRNSKGINEKYFFPSKFYNVLASPGKSLINDFHNIPEMVKKNCYVLEDDLTNLNEIIDGHSREDDIRNYTARLDWLNVHADWSYAIVQVKKLLDKA